MKTIHWLLGVALTGWATTGALAAGAEHWGYAGDSGPAHWAKLDPANAACAKGRRQSPIDLHDFIQVGMKPLAPAYASDAAEIEHNGHTVQVNYAAGSALTVDGRAYDLKQFHFHTPSENTLNGKRFPLEVHLVHKDASGKLAVVGVLFEEGAAHPLLAKLGEKLPKPGTKDALPTGLNARELLPTGSDYFRFNGSLTTPPCSEGVTWLVMKSPVTASKVQVEQLAHAIGFPNSRPVQPLNDRPVLE